MNRKEKCFTCRFFEIEYEDASYGHCHFSPPKNDGENESVWLIVDEEDWCSKWEAET